MHKKARTIITLLLVYVLMFWIGFRSGEIYSRSKKKLEVVIVPRPLPPLPPSLIRTFYVVEKQDYGKYSQVNFSEINEKDITIKFFLDKRLRPLLKMRNLKIYTSKGGRIY